MESQIPNPVFLNLEYIFFLIYRAVARFFNFIFGGNINDPDAGGRVFSGLKVFATILVILLITSILYSLVRLYEIEQEGKPKKVKSATNIKDITSQSSNEGPHFIDHGATRVNETWNSIRAKLLSDTPSDWKLAIIEADIYLDKSLDQKGFYGDTLGDKFKQITPDKLPSIQIAWEAHKVRNRIAHDGAGFILTMPEARRVLSYYEIVFRDLEVID
ncbi:MAG: hypothetical protein KBC11_02400 [Candidatus Pacebacteria bacterium]|nr:hypothetical protein [Candidatus Paceibacterota bacterium]